MTDSTANDTAPATAAPAPADGAPVALITGGSSGIGAAAAAQLLKHGYRVAATGRDTERLRRLAADLGDPDTLLTLPGDAADPDSVAAAVAATVDTFGRLDAAVANAGFATHDTIADGDPAGWRDMVLTNVLGPALLAHHALPALRATGGRIVLIGSVAGFINTPGNLYGATKWAVTALGENIRRQVTSDGVGVTLVAPGRVETAFWDGPGSERVDRGGLGRLLTSDQIAEAIVWAIRQPAGVDVNTVVIRPLGQPN